MSTILGAEELVFLDGDHKSPQEIPLMVTRHTLKSMNLSKGLLEQLTAGGIPDVQSGISDRAVGAPSEQAVEASRKAGLPKSG